MIKTKEYEFSSFWRRLGAFLVDGLILGLIETLLIFTACYLLNPRTLLVLILVQNVVFFLYRPFCHVRWGRTIGKKLMCIRVVQRQGSGLSWSKGLLREILFLPGLLFGMPALVLVLTNTPEIRNYAEYKSVMKIFYQGQGSLLTQFWMPYTLIIMLLQAGFVAFHPEHRALHDLIAGSVV
jgi:uncharacterized RDD family membrane protein YckC